MEKKAFRKVTLTPEQTKRLRVDRRFSPELDERLGRLIAAAKERKIRVRYLSASPASLALHNAEALEKAKVNLVEDPTLREAVLRGILDDSLPAILVYRNNNGDLCSFDDYLKLAVALDAKIDKVRVVVLGESDEWFKAKDQSAIMT